MAIKIRYFGALAEVTGVEEEALDLNEAGGSLEQLSARCLKKYQSLSGMTFKIARNRVMEQTGELTDGDEIAFLPPFAGG